MKRVLLLLLSISLLLVACSTKYVCPDGSTVTDVNSCPQSKAPAKALSAEIEDILSKSKNVESMSYDYKRVDKPLERPVHVWIKKLMVKREFNVQTEVLNKNEKDVIIFNLADKTATVYCESKKFCIKTGNVGAVDFNQYYVKTPLDWVDGVTSAEKKGEARLANRNVWILQLDENVTLWVDTYFGVPLRVDNGQERYEFQNSIFNSVEEKDVQFIEREDRYS